MCIFLILFCLSPCKTACTFFAARRALTAFTNPTSFSSKCVHSCPTHSLIHSLVLMLFKRIRNCHRAFKSCHRCDSPNFSNFSNSRRTSRMSGAAGARKRANSRSACAGKSKQDSSLSKYICFLLCSFNQFTLSG